MMYDFCNDAQQFLDADERNVIFVHCKAGKGRTGVMICAYLLYTGAITDPSICMAFYGMKRTTDGEGVTIPSQRRYIDYFSSVLAWPLFRQAQQPGSSTTGPSLEPNIAALDELQIITPMSNRKLAVRVSMRDASDAVVEVFSPDACLYELIGKSKLKVKVNNKVFFRGDIKIEVLLVKVRVKGVSLSLSLSLSLYLASNRLVSGVACLSHFRAISWLLARAIALTFRLTRVHTRSLESLPLP